MQKIESVHEMRSLAAQLNKNGKSVALVPTSGALHAGHAALIATAEERADVVVVTVFINPFTFGSNENQSAYPRRTDNDVTFCEELQVDVLFMPSVDEMFPRGFSTFVTEEVISKPLCGVSRPTYFRGVTTGLTKLLNVVRPNVVVAGQRDAQQARVMRKMIDDLGFDVEVVVTPIVRESDGLVVTARNRELSAGQRQEARAIYEALMQAQQMVAQGTRSTDRVIAEVSHMLGECRRIRMIYVSMVDPETMDVVREIVPGKTLLAIAAWIDEVRLIDNVML